MNFLLGIEFYNLEGKLTGFMDVIPLSSAEKKELRGLAQRLKPHVHVGKQGLSEAVLKEIDTALTKNGLIKLRFEADRAGIRAMIEPIMQSTGSEYVGGVGKTGVFFREMPEPAGKADSH